MGKGLVLAILVQLDQDGPKPSRVKILSQAGIYEEWVGPVFPRVGYDCSDIRKGCSSLKLFIASASSGPAFLVRAVRGTATCA